MLSQIAWLYYYPSLNIHINKKGTKVGVNFTCFDIYDAGNLRFFMSMSIAKIFAHVDFPRLLSTAEINAVGALLTALFEKRYYVFTEMFFFLFWICVVLWG